MPSPSQIVVGRGQSRSDIALAARLPPKTASRRTSPSPIPVGRGQQKKNINDCQRMCVRAFDPFKGPRQSPPRNPGSWHERNRNHPSRAKIPELPSRAMQKSLHSRTLADLSKLQIIWTRVVDNTTACLLWSSCKSIPLSKKWCTMFRTLASSKTLYTTHTSLGRRPTTEHSIGITNRSFGLLVSMRRTISSSVVRIRSASCIMSKHCSHSC
jgi:hypothetical protein